MEKYAIHPSRIGLFHFQDDMPEGGLVILKRSISRYGFIQFDQSTIGQAASLPAHESIGIPIVLDVLNCGSASITVEGFEIGASQSIRLTLANEKWSSSVSNNSEKETMTESVFTLQNIGVNSIIADGRESLYDYKPNGGQLGRHYYTITTQRNFLDPAGATNAVTIVAGANVAFINGVWEKSNSGNSWNASIYSDQIVIDSVIEDAAVSWLVEDDPDGDGETGAQGTVREMGGLDNDPDANSSYSSIEYAIYQINGNTFQFYEKGQNKKQVNLTLAAGDRLGVRVESGIVTYFHMRGTVVTDLWESETPTSEPLYFKGAFNRGEGSSGQSAMGDVQKHTALIAKPVTAQIEGPATAPIRDEHIAELARVGLAVDDGHLYSYFTAEKLSGDRFPDGNQHEFTHGYSVCTSQSIVSI